MNSYDRPIQVGDYVRRKPDQLNALCWRDVVDKESTYEVVGIVVLGGILMLKGLSETYDMHRFDRVIDEDYLAELQATLTAIENDIKALEAKIAAERAPKPGEVYHNLTRVDSFTVLDVYKGRVYGRREAVGGQQPRNGMIASASVLIEDFANLWPYKA